MKQNPYKRLFRYSLEYKWSFLLSIVGFITFAMADIAAVEWIRQIIGFIQNSDSELQQFLALSLIGIATARGIGFFVGNYFMARVGFGVVYQLRDQLFQKLHQLPKKYFDLNQGGQLINRITFTTTQVSGAASNAIKTIIREGFLLIGLLVYMTYLNWKLTLLLVVTVPLIALIVFIAGRRLRRLAKRIQTAMGDVTHIASEAVNGHVEIKSFGAETYENNRFAAANKSNKNQNLKLEATSNLATPIIQILVSISLSLVAYFALGSSLGISLDAETFVAFFTASGLMAKPIRQLSSVNGIIQKGLAAANEIFDQLDYEDEKDSGEVVTKIQGKINFKNVSFSYSEDKKVLNDINISIHPLETVAIVGKSGSGKSTIANLILRFYSSFSGEITIDDIPNIDYKLSHLRQSISVVTQSPTLFNDTIEKNIAYGDEIDSHKVMQSAELAGCMEFITKLPEGINSKIGDDGVLLSGGQRQRLAIARAFYKDSPIIILDEATSALDTESEEKIQESLEKLISNRTTIIIAHRLSTIENADQILVLDDGKITQQGKHNQLIEETGVYASLYKNAYQETIVEKTREITKISYLKPLEETESNSSFVVNAWYKKHLWLYLLFPFTLIFQFLTNRRRRKFLKNQISNYSAPVPVIVVGNINIGGTGKTPLVRYIASALADEGFSPGIVSRGYGGNFKDTLEVTSETPYQISGDEAQILSNLNMPLFLDKNRPRAIQKLLEKYSCDVIISDDGLQHYQMSRDVEILVIDGARRFGNNLCFPAGPLRESIKRKDTVDFKINNGGPTEENEYLMTLQPFRFVHLSSGKTYSIDEWPMHKEVHAVAGLGNPGRFFDALTQLGFSIERHPFPDHHKFMNTDFNFLDQHPIIMTEKDAARCKDFNNSKIWYLTVEPKIESDFIDQLSKKLNTPNIINE